MDTAVTNERADVTEGAGAGADKLLECYRGELSAVETYELAISSINEDAVKVALQEIMTNHQKRVERIRSRMIQTGVEVPESSGAWGAFAKLVQTGADLLSESTAVSALEEGEDHGLKLYTDLDDCESSVREFITKELLADQQRTHNLCRTLKKFVKLPA